MGASKKVDFIVIVLATQTSVRDRYQRIREYQICFNAWYVVELYCVWEAGGGVGVWLHL